MKGLRLLSVGILFLVSVIMIIGPVNAATNVFVNGSLPNNTLFQGQVYGLNLTITNNENYPVRVYSVGVNYDWMKSDIFYTLDTGNSYTQIEANSQANIGTIMVSCDNNVPVGYHAFYYKVQLSWYNSYMSAWVNETVVQPGSIYIESPAKSLAMTALQNANSSLNTAIASNYSSLRAKADIHNATISLQNGWSAYNSNDYSTAVNLTYTIIVDLNDARNGEADYQSKRAPIDVIINSVNDKLRAVQGVTSPDAKDLVNLTISYLNTTQQNIVSEDWVSAKKNANLADQAVDSASNSEYFYRLNTNQSVTQKDSAARAVQAAQDTIQNADSIISSGSAVNILNEASIKLQTANQSLNSGDYTNATVNANVASTLATQAITEEANNQMAQARQKITGIGELKSPSAKDMLNQSNTAYNQSQDAYTSGDYQGAIANASLSFKLANDSATTEQKWLAEHPALPGFEAVYAIAALLSIFGIVSMRARKERKD
jgi:hypothetical protein